MRDLQLLLARLALAAWFVYEGVDKVARFSQWVEFVEKAGLPWPEAEMGLVVGLLWLGAISLATGYRMGAGVAMLLLFQLPTTLLFEWSGELTPDVVKSVSVMGGLLAIAAAGPGRWTIGLRVGPGP